ncbi:MAG: hypothetical protein KAT90_03925, partial [Gammaproteobacteria bacterium]|nr:hypothetical protein [Gammaproteobacteria bacterium]
MNKKLMHLFLLLSIGLMNGSLAAETSKNIERRIELISTLLTKSSVNKKIKYSGSDVAKQYFKYAQTSFDDAVKEYHRGDIEQADFHLKNSKQAVFEAVMYANLKWTGNDQDRQAYEAKRRSVDALTDALKRVSKTKDKTKESLVIIKKVTELTQQADQKYFRKHYKEALDIVHRSLEIVEVAIASMRTGDTLVNTLNFDDDEDEYRYEIDRNDT